MTVTEDVLAYMTLALQTANRGEDTPEEVQRLVGQSVIDLLANEPVDALGVVTGVAFGLLSDLSTLTGRTREDLWQERALAYTSTEESSA